MLAVASAVDPTLVKDGDSHATTASSVLDEMLNSGNRIADYQRRELDQLYSSLHNLQEMSVAATAQLHVLHATPESTASYNVTTADGASAGDGHIMPDFDFGSLLCEWDSEDGLSSQQLIEVADSLDFSQLNWPAMADLDGWG